MEEVTIMGTEFHPGVNHGHEATGRWSEIQKNPNSPGNPWWIEGSCKERTPLQFVTYIKRRFWFNPLAGKHIEYYLKGTGVDFNENDALKIVLERDSGVRQAISKRLPSRSSDKKTASFKLEQKHYNLDDAKNSWGGIDILDLEVDYDADKLHVWFKDRYEWHPYYPGNYTAYEDDEARETNCIHAAFVEMKSEGAADFWMVGDVTVPLKPFIGFGIGGIDWGSRGDIW